MSTKNVYAVVLKSATPTPPLHKDWKVGPSIKTHLALATSEVGAIALAQKAEPGSVVSCSRLGSEEDLAPRGEVVLEINGETFKYKHEGLLASAPAGTKLLGRG